MKIFALVLLLFIFMCQGTVYAQGNLLMPQKPKAPTSMSTSAIFNQLPPEIQREILDEALFVYDECKVGGGLKTYMYDCQCFAERYIDARVVSPDETIDRVRNIMDTTSCISEAGVAGYLYETCFSNNSYKANVDALCTCVANKGSEEMISTGTAGGKVYTYHYAQALVECQNAF